MATKYSNTIKIKKADGSGFDDVQISYVGPNHTTQEGVGTIAEATIPGQHVEGKYNLPIAQIDGHDALHVVGNGTGPETANRHNAYAINADGSGFYTGGVVASSLMVATAEDVSKFINGEQDELEGEDLLANHNTLVSQVNNFNTQYTEWKNNYDVYLDRLQTEVDDRAEIWYLSQNEMKIKVQEWLSEIDGATKHFGDLWCNTDQQDRTFVWTDITNDMGWSIVNNEFVYSLIKKGYGWKEMNGVPQDIFDKADKAATLFSSKPSNYKENDIWILDVDNPKGTTYIDYPAFDKGTLLVAKNANTGYDLNDWEEKVKYSTALKNLQNQIDRKIETWYQASEPIIQYPAEHIGDYWYDTDTQQAYIYTATSYTNASGAEEIEYAWKETEDLLPLSGMWDTLDGKKAIYTELPANAQEGDLLIPSAPIINNGISYSADHVYRYVNSEWKEVSYVDEGTVDNKIQNINIDEFLAGKEVLTAAQITVEKGPVTADGYAVKTIKIGDKASYNIIEGSDTLLLEKPYGTEQGDGAKDNPDTKYVKIKKDGTFIAENAVIHGTIHAYSGDFTGDIKCGSLQGTSDGILTSIGSYKDSNLITPPIVPILASQEIQKTTLDAGYIHLNNGPQEGEQTSFRFDTYNYPYYSSYQVYDNDKEGDLIVFGYSAYRSVLNIFPTGLTLGTYSHATSTAESYYKEHFDLSNEQLQFKPIGLDANSAYTGLIVNKDGMKWNGSSILTSSSSLDMDKVVKNNKKISDLYLPLAGGTMTGTLNMKTGTLNMETGTKITFNNGASWIDNYGDDYIRFGLGQNDADYKHTIILTRTGIFRPFRAPGEDTPGALVDFSLGKESAKWDDLYTVDAHIDNLLADNLQSGYYSLTDNNKSVAANSYTDITITFPKAFSAEPHILLTLKWNVAEDYENGLQIVVAETSATGFKARIYNHTRTARHPGFSWMAHL